MMRFPLPVLSSCLVLALIGCRGPEARTRAGGGEEPPARTAEAGCALCMFHVPGVSDCVLGVRIEGKTYLVQGSDIDDHGDAHAADGLCKTIRAARVAGRVEGEVFVASRFVLESTAAAPPQ